MSTSRQGRATKSRRITRACDYCHRRSIRCEIAQHASQCHNCIRFGQPCTYEREPRRRGVKPRQQAQPHAPGKAPSPDQMGTQDQGTTKSWVAPIIARQAAIMDLVEIYFEIVYPIFPLFHRPTFIRKVSRAEYNTDKRLFATTMAVCALVSARIRDQALFNTSWDPKEFSEPPSETFYDTAIQMCAMEAMEQSTDLESLRVWAILALATIQYGRIPEMQANLGRYHALVAVGGLHDETNWPEDIGIVEIEERRRLLWSMYTLEIYVSIIWNGMTRVREQQINVAYTTEVDDELFSDRGYSQQAPYPINIGSIPNDSWGEISNSSWLCGWNFTTDLYRVMEHVITKFRNRRGPKNILLNEIFGNQNDVSESAVRNHVMRLYSNLPQCFKQCPKVSCEPSSDRYGFQAANIIATVQLLRMMLFTAGGGSIEQRCQITGEVVDAFSSIPVAYLRAISSPLLYHLAGIGVILGRVFDEPLTVMAHQQVRAIILALAELLENINLRVHSVTSVQRLRDLVAQIDDYVKAREEQLQIHHELDDSTGPPSTEQINIPGQTLQTPLITPSQLATNFFEGLPWNLDFMQLGRD